MTDLGPPLAHHVPARVISQEHLAVQNLKSNLLQATLHRSVELVILSDVVALNGLTTIATVQEFPYFFVENLEIVHGVLILFDILVNVLRLHSLNFACAVEVLAIGVLLTELVRIHNGSGVHSREVSLLVKLELIFGNILVELLTQDELLVCLEPLERNDVGGRANIFVRLHVILLL